MKLNDETLRSAEKSSRTNFGNFEVFFVIFKSIFSKHTL